MSLYNTNRHNILKLSQESILKPKNKKLYLNLSNNNKYNLFGNITKFDIGKYKRIKPIYKKFNKILLNQKINNKLYTTKINNLQQYSNIQNKFLRKNNSFLFDCSKTEEKDIFAKFEKLKFKIRRNNRNIYSYNQKNIRNNSNTNTNCYLYPNNNKIDNKFYETKEIFQRKNIKLNNISQNNIYKITKTNLMINNSTSDEDKINEKNNTCKIYSINTEKGEERKKQIYAYANRDDLIKENKKLKMELEYSNKQIKKYKKYRELYLNLMKSVKSNKNMIKNINSNKEDINKNVYFNNYVNEILFINFESSINY